MSTSFYTINLRRTLDPKDSAYMGEKALNSLLSDFSCPPNQEVEQFLKHSAIEFTKKSQSVTYLVFNRVSYSDLLVGYFTLTIKPLSVRASAISKTMGRKLARVSVLNPVTNTYTASAYLVAQLGKNFALPKEERIGGAALLDLAGQRIAKTQYDIGGVVEFLECEDTPFLLDFYARNGFKAFDRRTAASEDDEEELVQLLRFI
ncbi:MAG: GNAT family acetyltransferase [Selenomonadaceae bacterium]|nr:GNAT family acetyltransferase [Selenomonadaceae bacterium]